MPGAGDRVGPQEGSVRLNRKTCAAVVGGLVLVGLAVSGCRGAAGPWSAAATGSLVLELAPDARGARGAVLYLERVADPEPRSSGPRVYEVTSEGPDFRPPLQVVRPGSEVVFVNHGGLAHRLFSADDRGRRERALAPGGRSEPLTIARAGGQRFYCSLHPEESFVLFASPSDHFVVPDGRPQVRMDALPVGAYRLSWWSDAGVSTAGHFEIHAGETARRAISSGPATP